MRPIVQLQDIVTEDDEQAVLGLRRGPGQDRYLGRMISHFEDAALDARACPRMWSVHHRDDLVGVVMISDGIPAETLAADDALIGPYYLWRLLIDHRVQGRGFGSAAIDAVVGYLRTRPDAVILWTSCAAGDGSPQPFYLRYGFKLTGETIGGEDILRLDLAGTRRTGMIIDQTTEKGAHALARLESSFAGWLTTVTPDGQPQSMPVWFLWTGEEILVYGDHRARRNRNLDASPLVSFHLPDEGRGGDVVTFEATARVDPGYRSAGDNPKYLAKYQAAIDADLGGPAKFSEAYSMPILITPTRMIVFQG